MMVASIRRAAIALALVLPIAACDQSSTGPSGFDEFAADRQSQILLGSDAAASASAALLSQSAAEPGKGNAGGKGAKNGPIDLSTVAEINVQITSVEVLLASDVAEGQEADGNASWIELDLGFDPAATWFDLKNLSDIVELATVPTGLEGEIHAVRLFFGDADVVFTDGSSADLRIPSGKVTIPASGLVIGDGEDVALIFQPGASVKKIIRTGNGLLMPPVFVASNPGGNAGDDENEEEEDEEA